MVIGGWMMEIKVQLIIFKGYSLNCYLFKFKNEIIIIEYINNTYIYIYYINTILFIFYNKN